MENKKTEWDPILDVYPKDGYFADYYNMAKAGEICPRFHFFTSAAILGAVVNRNVYFQRGSKTTFPPLFPNLWIILMGPQGEGHKSSSLRIGRELMLALDEQIRPRILSAKLTPERLVQTLASVQIPTSLRPPVGIDPKTLAQDAIAVIYSSELANTLGREKYNQGFISLLTDLYDCHDEWSSETIMRGDQRLTNVCLTIMGASTPDWMQSMLPIDAFKGGFMSRLLLIVLPKGWDKAVADPDPPTEEQVLKVVDHLKYYSTIQGRMHWGKGAQAWWTNWYENVYRKKKRMVTGPMAAYLERKQDHLLRFAILLQLNKSPDNLQLEIETIQQALDIMAAVEPETESVIDFISTEPSMRAAQMCLEFLRKYKTLPEHTLRHLVWRNLKHPKEFDNIIEMLYKAKDIVGIDIVDKKTGKTDLGWKYTGRDTKGIHF